MNENEKWEGLIKDLRLNMVDDIWNITTGYDNDITIEDNELTMIVPGFDKDDFDITVDGDILNIKAEKDKYGIIDKSFKINSFVSGMDIVVFNGILTATFIWKPSNVEINIS